MRQRYSKHYLSPRQIIGILKEERGLLFEDETKAAKYLTNIGYQRLGPYIHPFYKMPKSEKKIKHGTSFGDVMRLYRFDKKLRMLLFNEIEKIEVAIRSVLTGKGCVELGDDFWLTNQRHFVDAGNFEQMRRAIEKELETNGEDFIVRFRNYYTNPYPPVWMVMEILSFGKLNYIYSNLASNRLKKAVANYFGMRPKIFTSWLTMLVNIRNRCCHHERIWNKEFVVTPVNPRSLRHNWIDEARADKSRIYYRICIVKYFLNTISPQNNMRDKLVDLFGRFPQIDLAAMGFPPDWESEPLWQGWFPIAGEV